MSDNSTSPFEGISFLHFPTPMAGKFSFTTGFSLRRTQ